MSFLVFWISVLCLPDSFNLSSCIIQFIISWSFVCCDTRVVERLFDSCGIRWVALLFRATFLVGRKFDLAFLVLFSEISAGHSTEGGSYIRNMRGFVGLVVFGGLALLLHIYCAVLRIGISMIQSPISISALFVWLPICLLVFDIPYCGSLHFVRNWESSSCYIVPSDCLLLNENLLMGMGYG